MNRISLSHIANSARNARIKFGTRITAMGLTTALVLALTACGNPKEKLYEMYHQQVSSVGDLTDEMVLKYIKTYRILKKNGRNYLQYISKDPDKGQAGFNAIQKDIQSGGFEDYAEFVKVNAKIAWAWNLAQARIGMEKQGKLQKWAQSTTDSGIAVIQKQLNNPDVPESTKKELRKTLAQLQAQKKTLAGTYAKNKKWADWAMNFTKPLTNSKDIEVILRHKNALMEVFTGLSREQLNKIHEHSMKQLDIK